eukprot:360124-Chlamydomonas_euryale.AAC.5
MPPVWPRVAMIGVVWLRADEHMGVAARPGYLLSSRRISLGILKHQQNPSAAVNHLQLFHRLLCFSSISSVLPCPPCECEELQICGTDSELQCHQCSHGERDFENSICCSCSRPSPPDFQSPLTVQSQSRRDELPFPLTPSFLPTSHIGMTHRRTPVIRKFALKGLCPRIFEKRPLLPCPSGWRQLARQAPAGPDSVQPIPSPPAARDRGQIQNRRCCQQPEDAIAHLRNCMHPLSCKLHPLSLLGSLALRPPLPPASSADAQAKSGAHAIDNPHDHELLKFSHEPKTFRLECTSNGALVYIIEFLRYVMALIQTNKFDMSEIDTQGWDGYAMTCIDSKYPEEEDHRHGTESQAATISDTVRRSPRKAAMRKVNEDVFQNKTNILFFLQYMKALPIPTHAEGFTCTGAGAGCMHVDGARDGNERGAAMRGGVPPSAAGGAAAGVAVGPPGGQSLAAAARGARHSGDGKASCSGAKRGRDVAESNGGRRRGAGVALMAEAEAAPQMAMDEAQELRRSMRECVPTQAPG